MDKSRSCFCIHCELSLLFLQDLLQTLQDLLLFLNAVPALNADVSVRPIIYAQMGSKTERVQGTPL